MATVRPTFDRILIRPDEPVSLTKKGIHIPDMSQDKPATGTVVAVGPGRLTREGTFACGVCRPGDQVTYNRYAGTQIQVDEVDHLLMREGEVLYIHGHGKAK